MTTPPTRLDALPAGTVLAREGRPIPESVLVVEGRARVRRSGEQQGELVPGDLLEAVAVSATTVVAETDMRVAVVATAQPHLTEPIQTTEGKRP